MLISENDVALFARVSGDRNPLHCSPAYARATMFGAPVVHGVLAVLATLDEQEPRGAGVSAVEAEFGHPVYPGVEYRTEDLGGARYRLLDGERVCLTVRVRPGPDQDLAPLVVPPRQAASRLAIADLSPGTGVSGAYGPDAVAELAARFPAAARLLGRGQLTCLLWSTYLAGMRLPGERCLLGSVALRFRPVAVTGPARLSYTADVVHTDPRFGLVSIGGQVAADGAVVAEAEIEAMVRAPAPPPSAADIGTHLSPSTRLLGRSAVVVGGSRGLGAAVALTLVSQGCEVHVGHRGTLPAALVAESEPLPGRLRSAPGDAASPEWAEGLRTRLGGLDFLVCAAAPPVGSLDLLPTHLDRLTEFVAGSLRLVGGPLAGLLDLVAGANGRCLVISSAALADPPRDWPHYVTAKAGVEGLVSWAARHHPEVGFLLARPEMLRTEQMNSPSTWELAGAVEPVAAELVRQLLDATPASGRPRLVDLVPAG